MCYEFDLEAVPHTTLLYLAFVLHGKKELGFGMMKASREQNCLSFFVVDVELFL